MPSSRPLSPTSYAILSGLPGALAADPQLGPEVLDLLLGALAAGTLDLDPLTRRRIDEASFVARAGERLAQRDLSSKQMAMALGVAEKTFRAGVRTDPRVLGAATDLPTPTGKRVRRWRPWEVRALWPAGVPKRKRRIG